MKLQNLKRCFLIAEVSANHGQKFERAAKMIEVAKKCGADAVKFQLYSPDGITVNADNKYFRIKHPVWGGQTLYQLYQKAYTPWDWFKKLKKIADGMDIVFFASVFDLEGVDFLEDLGVQIHKISSFELVDLPLIEKAAKTGKPLIISTGMARLGEIKEAAEAARKVGCKDLSLLKCVSSYPAKPEEMNLRTIVDMQKRFKCTIGLSDHTMGVGVAVASVSLGARIIEKHFTLSRKHKTPDDFFSLEPDELRDLVENVRMAEAALGKTSYGLTDKQKKMRVFRRSIFAYKDIDKGEPLSMDNIKSVRPSAGLAPKYLPKLIGKKAGRRIKKGTPVSLDMLG